MDRGVFASQADPRLAGPARDAEQAVVCYAEGVRKDRMMETVLPAGDPQKLGFSLQGLRRLDAVIGEAIAHRRFPGAVSLIARNGEVAWFGSQGKLTPHGDTPMPADAIFRIYSMTKPIVSVAIMMLAEEGKLLLADPIHKYMPEFAGLKVGVEEAGRLELVEPRRPIAIQDLLRHTSGFTYDFVATGPLQKLYLDANLRRRNRTNEEFCQALAQLPLYRHPGTTWDYSVSTDVLGRLIEVLSGKSLREVLHEEILSPLGMIDTDFFVPPEKQSRIAEPFATDPETGEAANLLDPRKNPEFQSGGGGLMSTAQDYARFLQMLLNGGTLGSVRILGRKSIELMTADHLPPGTPVNSDILPPGYGFGLGFAVRTAAGLASGPGSAGQYFWGGIAGTTFFIDPRENLFALSLIQAPAQREYYRMLFRNLVYAAL
jgi:CubicO group peptidase (beta-lactamase class C family)